MLPIAKYSKIYTLKICRNSIRHMGAYAPAAGKKHFEMTKKFKQKFSRSHIDILCAHIKFCDNFFV
jgi:hypothetical protein